MSDTSLLAAKKEMRQSMLVRRAGMALENPAAAQKLCTIFLDNITAPSQSIISGYIAQKFEIDPVHLISALRAAGHTLSLPVVMGRGTNLLFRVHDEGVPLAEGAARILEPPPSAPLVTPDILIVPLLAFDRRGYRLGYGGGYYDRTLLTLRAQKPVLAVGVAFAAQEVPVIPHGLHDALLDHIVTDREFITP